MSRAPGGGHPAPPGPAQPGPAASPAYRDIAVIRLSSLGDVVLTLPVVHALAKGFPGARVGYWVKEEFADLVRHDPAITHVRELERDARRIEDLVSMSAELEDCDLIVDLHASLRSRVLTARQKARVLRVGNQRLLRARWVHARWSGPRPAPHALDRYARTVAPLGVTPAGPPRLTAGAEAEQRAADWIGRSFGTDPVVAFCPAARHATKRWPEEHWRELLARIAPTGMRVAAFSLPREREGLAGLAQAIEKSRGAWCTEPLGVQVAALGHMRAAVTGDTGLMHVAAARGLPVVALFGSTSPVLGFAPAGEGHAVLCRNEPCQPCTLHGRDACPRGHFRCMRELAPGQVFESLSDALAPA